jgi:hypothetical protein
MEQQRFSCGLVVSAGVGPGVKRCKSVDVLEDYNILGQSRFVEVWIDQHGRVNLDPRWAALSDCRSIILVEQMPVVPEWVSELPGFESN